MTKVSILIPVYNSIKYLKECIDSVVEQTLQDIEIICVDDGSTDGAEALLDQYALSDNRIRVIHKQNTGYGSSMNIALSLATGEYIGIVESDDFVDKTMFESLYCLACKTNVEVIKGQFYEHRDGHADNYKDLFSGVPKHEIQRPPYNEIIRPVDYFDLFQGFVYLWSGIYKRAYLFDNDIRFNETPGASFQDIGFTYKVWCTSSKLMLIEDAFYHYRVDNANSSVKSNGKIYCVSDEFDELWHYLYMRPNILKKVQYAIPPAQFRRYGETRGRLNYEAKMLFKERFLGDFVFLRLQGYINQDYWSEDAWDDYSARMGDFYRATSEYKLRVLLQELKKNNKKYIYGAGKIGTEVLTDMQKLGIEIEAVLVTDSANNPSNLNGIQVLEVKDSKDIVKRGIVFVCVRMQDQDDIVDYVNSLGIFNVIKMDKTVRNALRHI